MSSSYRTALQQLFSCMMIDRFLSPRTGPSPFPHLARDHAKRGGLFEYMEERVLFSTVPPTVADISKTVVHDHPGTFALSDFTSAFTDTNSSNNTLQTIEILTLPAHGTLVINGTEVTSANLANASFPASDLNGIAGFFYTPNPGFLGTDSFEWNGSDGNNNGTNFAASPANVTLTFTNQPPTVSNVTITDPKNVTFDFSVSNFTSQFNDPDGDTLGNVTILSLPINGNLSLSGVRVIVNQSISQNDLANLTYTPNTGVVNSTDSFGWNADDGIANAGTPADVNISIINRPPVLSDLTVNGTTDVNHSFALADFTALFIDPDVGDTLQSIEFTSLPTHGMLLVNDSGPEGGAVTVNEVLSPADIADLVYVPTDGAHGTDTFQWNASDGTDFAVNAANLTMNISLPTVSNSSLSLAANLTSHFTTGEFTGHYSAPDVLQTVKIVTLPTNGTLKLSGVAVTANQSFSNTQLGNLTYTPNANATTDSFTWTGESVFNGNSTNTGFATTPATITLTLVAPSVASFSVQANENLANNPSLSNISLSTFGSHFLPTGVTLADVKILTVPGHGSLTLNGNTVTANETIALSGNTTLVYTPTLNFVGTDSLTWTASADGTAIAGPAANVTITVDTPPVVATNFSKIETNTITGHFALTDFTAGYTDTANIPLQSIEIITAPANGTLKLNGVTVTANQTISAANISKLTYTPNAKSTSDRFTWEASDGIRLSNLGTVNFTVLTIPKLTAITGVYDLSGAPTNFLTTTTNGNVTTNTNYFALNFSDTTANFTLQTVKITALPKHGTLTLGATPVKVGMEISLANISNLTYKSTANFVGFDTFGWNGSDGVNYATSASTVTITDLAPLGVIGNGIPILNNEKTPTVTNFTDFASWTLSPDSSMGADTRTFTIRNSSNATMTLSNITISGPNAGDFSVSAQPANLTLASDATTTFTIAFLPHASGKRLASITIGSSAGGPFVFEVQGTGIVTNLINTSDSTGTAGVVQEGTTQRGSGQVAVNGEIVSIKYTGYLANGGTIFDSSAFHTSSVNGLTFRLDDAYSTTGANNQPFLNKDEANVNLGNTTSLANIDFPVIAGWEFGLQGIKPGEKRTLVIDGAAGYGANGVSNSTIPPNATLIFDVQCVLVNPKPQVELLFGNNGATFSLSNASTSSTQTNTFFLFDIAADNANGTPLAHWNLKSVQLNGHHRPDFSFSLAADTTYSGVTDVNVSFHPLTTGVKDETLNIITSDPIHPNLAIHLTGNSTPYIDIKPGFDSTYLIHVPKRPVTSGSGQTIPVPVTVSSVSDANLPGVAMTNIQIYAENTATHLMTLVAYINNIDLGGLQVKGIKRFYPNVPLPYTLASGTYDFVAEVNLAAPLAAATISGLVTLPATWATMVQGGGLPSSGSETMTDNDSAIAPIGITVVQGVYNPLGGYLSNPSIVQFASGGVGGGSVTVNVENTGTIYTTPTQTIRFDIIAHPIAGGSDVTLASNITRSAANIAPNGVVGYTIPIGDAPTGTLSAGNYLLEAHVTLEQGTAILASQSTIATDRNLNSVPLRLNTLGGSLNSNVTSPSAGTATGNVTVSIQDTGSAFSLLSQSLHFDIVAQPTGGGSNVTLVSDFTFTPGTLSLNGTSNFTIPVNLSNATALIAGNYTLQADMTLEDGSTVLANLTISGGANGTLLVP